VNKKTSEVSSDPPGSSSQPALLLAQTKRSRFLKFLRGGSRAIFSSLSEVIVQMQMLKWNKYRNKALMVFILLYSDIVSH